MSWIFAGPTRASPLQRDRAYVQDQIYSRVALVMGVIVSATAVGWAQPPAPTDRSPSPRPIRTPWPICSSWAIAASASTTRPRSSRCKDQYWIFCTGRGTPSFHSKDLITWERGPQTFTQVARVGGPGRAGQSQRTGFLGPGRDSLPRQVPALLLRLDLRQEHLRHRAGHERHAGPVRSRLRMEGRRHRRSSRALATTSTPSIRRSPWMPTATCGCPSARSGAASS